MPSSHQKMLEKMLKNLEDKITAKLMPRIENMFSENCKAIFEEKKPMKQQFKQLHFRLHKEN